MEIFKVGNCNLGAQVLGLVPVASANQGTNECRATVRPLTLCDVIIITADVPVCVYTYNG